MKKVDEKLIAEITKASLESPRHRSNVIFHKYEDKVQRMIQVLQTDTYAQPHRHIDPDKVEMFIIIDGEMAVIEFNDSGEIVDWAILSKNKGVYAAEIPPRTWHSIVCFQANTSIIEILEGPYEESTHKKFAQWAPEEGTSEAKRYLTELKSRIKEL